MHYYCYRCSAVSTVAMNCHVNRWLVVQWSVLLWPHVYRKNSNPIYCPINELLVPDDTFHYQCVPAARAKKTTNGNVFIILFYREAYWSKWKYKFFCCCRSPLSTFQRKRIKCTINNRIKRAIHSKRIIPAAWSDSRGMFFLPPFFSFFIFAELSERSVDGTSSCPILIITWIFFDTWIIRFVGAIWSKLFSIWSIRRQKEKKQKIFCTFSLLFRQFLSVTRSTWQFFFRHLSVFNPRHRKLYLVAWSCAFACS